MACSSRSAASGGLFEQIGGKRQPACGWAMGIERLLSLLEADVTSPQAPDVYLVNQGEEAARLAHRVAESLRDYGFSVVHHCGGGSFKSQMKRADASGAAVAVIVGDEEARAGEASIKPLREAVDQARVRLDDLPEAVADILYSEEREV